MDDMRDLVAGFILEAEQINEKLSKINQSAASFKTVADHYDFLMRCVDDPNYTVSIEIAYVKENIGSVKMNIKIGSGEKAWRDKIFTRIISLTKHRINWHRGRVLQAAKELRDGY